MGRLTVPWAVLLVPFIFPVSVFGEENWAKLQQAPVIGSVARVLSSGIFESSDVMDAAGVPFTKEFLPTAGLAVFLGYQVIINVLPRMGIRTSFSVDVPAVPKIPKSNKEATKDEAPIDEDEETLGREESNEVEE
jgi:hypothetical protein